MSNSFNSDVSASTNENEQNVGGNGGPSLERPEKSIGTNESKKEISKAKAGPVLSWQDENFSASLTSSHQNELYNNDVLQGYQMDHGDQLQENFRGQFHPDENEVSVTTPKPSISASFDDKGDNGREAPVDQNETLTFDFIELEMAAGPGGSMEAQQCDRNANEMNRNMDNHLYLGTVDEQLPRVEARDEERPPEVIVLDPSASDVDLTFPIEEAGAQNEPHDLVNDTFAQLRSSMSSPVSALIDASPTSSSGVSVVSIGGYDLSSYMHTPSNTSDGSCPASTRSNKKKSFSQLIVEGITESHPRPFKSTRDQVNSQARPEHHDGPGRSGKPKQSWAPDSMIESDDESLRSRSVSKKKRSKEKRRRRIMVIHSDDEEEDEDEKIVKRKPNRRVKSADDDEDDDDAWPPKESKKKSMKHSRPSRAEKPSANRAKSPSKKLYKRVKQRMSVVGEEHESSTSDDLQLNEAALKYEGMIRAPLRQENETGEQGENEGQDKATSSKSPVTAAQTVELNGEARESTHERRMKNSLSDGFSQIFSNSIEESFRSMPNPFSGHSLSQPCDRSERYETNESQKEISDQPEKDAAVTAIDGTASNHLQATLTEEAQDGKNKQSDSFQAAFNYVLDIEKEQEQATTEAHAEPINEKKRRNSESLQSEDLTSEQDSKKARPSVEEAANQPQENHVNFLSYDAAAPFEDKESEMVLSEIVNPEPASNEREQAGESEQNDQFLTQDTLHAQETDASKLQVATPLSHENSIKTAPVTQEEQEASPSRHFAAPTKSSIQITRKPATSVVINGRNQPMTSSSPLETIKCYTRYVIKKTTQTVVKTTVTRFKQICDINDNVLKSCVVSSRSNQRIIADNCDKKFIPAGRPLDTSDYDDQGSNDVFEDADVFGRKSSHQEHEDDLDDANLSSLENSTYELDDFIDNTEVEDENKRLKEIKRRDAVIQSMRPVVSIARLPTSQVSAASKASASRGKIISASSLNQELGRRKNSSRGDERTKTQRRNEQSQAKEETSKYRRQSSSKLEEKSKNSTPRVNRRHSEDESRASKTPASKTVLHRSTRNSNQLNLEPITDLKERVKRRQEDTKSSKNHSKYQEKPLVCFTDLKLKLSTRELNMDHENLKSQLQTMPNGGGGGDAECESPERPLEKSTRNNVQLRNAFNLSHEEDTLVNMAANAALKHASSSTLPLYQTPMVIPFDPNESYRGAVQQAIEGIESFENQCNNRVKILNGPEIVEPATYSTSVTANYMESLDDEHLIQPMQNDLVDHEITIPFQGQTEDELVSASTYPSQQAIGQDVDDLPDMSQLGDDSMSASQKPSETPKRGRPKRVRAPLAQFAQSFSNKTPAKTQATANEERLKINFNIKECSVTMEKIGEQELRELMAKRELRATSRANDEAAKKQSPNESTSSDGAKTRKKIVRNVRPVKFRRLAAFKNSPALARKQETNTLTGSSSSVFTVDDGHSDLHESASKTSDFFKIVSPAGSASPVSKLSISAHSTYSTGDHVFARKSDGHYHPAVIVSIGEVFTSNGSSCPTYSCAFVEDTDQLVHLDTELIDTSNHRHTELIKASLLSGNDQVFVKSSANRKSKYLTGKLLKTIPKTSGGKPAPPEFSIQFIENGRHHQQLIPFGKVVVPKIQENNSWSQVSFTSGKRLAKSPLKPSSSKTFKTSNEPADASDEHYSIDHGYCLETRRVDNNNNQRLQQYSRVNTLKWKRTSTSSISSAESLLAPKSRLVVLEPLDTFTISQSEQQIFKSS